MSKEKTFEQRIAKLEAKIDEQSKRLDDLLLRVWMAGEENGRKHLSMFNKLDGSKQDFERWVNEEKIL